MTSPVARARSFLFVPASRPERFSPAAAEVEWARRVLAGAQEHKGQAFSLDGRMVDLPVIRQAEITLRQAIA